MRKEDRFKGFVEYFSAALPNPTTALHYETPFQLLVAVVLSAQCTDKRVNKVTPALFAAFEYPEVLSNASAEEVYPYIRSISYPHNKAKYLHKLARVLVHEHDAHVPQTVDALIKLPGVGRKTAHVIASCLYGTPVLAVDTHVFRVAKRIGLAPQSASTPLAVEKALCKGFAKRDLPRAHHWLILHGRRTCKARRAACNICPIQGICRSYEKRLFG